MVVDKLPDRQQQNYANEKQKAEEKVNQKPEIITSKMPTSRSTYITTLSKHEALAQCWADAVPSSTTGQRLVFAEPPT